MCCGEFSIYDTTYCISLQMLLCHGCEMLAELLLTSYVPHPLHCLSTGDDCSVSSRIVTWHSLDTSSAPIGRASAGAEVVGDHLYVYGGETLVNRYTMHSNYTVAFYRRVET